MKTNSSNLLWIIILALLFSGCNSAGTPSPKSSPTKTSTAIHLSSPTVPIIPTELSTPTNLPKEKPTPPAAITPVNISGSALSLISETIPDGNQIKAGQGFTKTWTVRNNGNQPWIQGFKFTKVAQPAGNDIPGSPQNVTLSGQVEPGQEVQLSVNLTAPATDGRYAVYYHLEDIQGNIVDKSLVWVSITVGDIKPVVSGSGTIGGVSATLKSFTPGDHQTSVSFCLTLPNRNYGPLGDAVSMTVDQKTVPSATGEMTSPACFTFDFPISANQISSAGQVTVSIARVGILGGVNDPQGACESAKSKLTLQYPGLDFTCHFSMAGYYTALKLPATLTAVQADSLITNTIEGVITGPWVITIK